MKYNIVLFYHIGVRQSMEMKYNIVLFYDTDPEQSVALRVSMIRYRTVLSYRGPTEHGDEV